MTTITGVNLADMVSELAFEVLQSPDIPSRNGECRELLGASVRIPLDHGDPVLPLSARRKEFLLAKIFETVWVMSGSDDATLLQEFLPRALDYSDDGKTWRGAYGPRLHKWYRHDHVLPSQAFLDQFVECRDLLVKDPDSRRAVMVIYDPAQDFCESKDIPCNDLVQFLVRDDKVNVVVYARSCDIMWGLLGINAYEWAAYAHLMANKLHLGVGTLVIQYGSLHIYKPHYAKLEKLGKECEKIMYPGKLSSNQAMARSMIINLLPSIVREDPKRLMDNLLEAKKSSIGTNKCVASDEDLDKVINIGFDLWREAGKQPYCHDIYNKLCEELRHANR